MEQENQGVTPSGPGLSPSVEPVPVSPADAASIPNADRDADDAARLGALYKEIKDGQYGCRVMRCTFPHDGNCWCFNTALSRHIASAIETRSAKTEGLGPQDESAVAKPDAQNGGAA